MICEVRATIPRLPLGSHFLMVVVRRYSVANIYQNLPTLASFPGLPLSRTAREEEKKKKKKNKRYVREEGLGTRLSSFYYFEEYNY